MKLFRRIRDLFARLAADEPADRLALLPPEPDLRADDIVDVSPDGAAASAPSSR